MLAVNLNLLFIIFMQDKSKLPDHQFTSLTRASSLLKEHKRKHEEMPIFKAIESKEYADAKDAGILLLFLKS